MVNDSRVHGCVPIVSKDALVRVECVIGIDDERVHRGPCDVFGDPVSERASERVSERRQGGTACQFVDDQCNRFNH